MDDQRRPDLSNSYLEHRSMRVDAARLTALVEAVGPIDERRLRAVADWYAQYEGAIHHHHEAEEKVIYPALLERDPSFAEADGELEGEHRVLADRLAVARESIAGLAGAAGGSRWEREREETVKATRALESILDVHLPHEEGVAFPRYTAAFTAGEYEALNKAAWKVVGMRSVVFSGPWVLDHATPAERADLLRGQPVLLRLLYRLALRPRYERLARAVRPASEPPVTGSAE